MKELIGRLEEVYERVLELSRQLNLDRRDMQQVYAACLHAILLERLSASLILLKSEQTAGVAVILRELFEVYADLVNLVRCPEYVVRLRATLLRERQRTKAPDPAAAATLTDLERYGLGELATRERFERAGLAALHDSLHAFATRHSHHNLERLADELLRESQGQYRLGGTHSCGRDALMPFLHMLAGVVVDSYRRLAQLAHRHDPDALAQVTEVLKRYMHTARARAA